LEVDTLPPGGEANTKLPSPAKADAKLAEPAQSPSTELPGTPGKAGASGGDAASASGSSSNPSASARSEMRKKVDKELAEVAAATAAVNGDVTNTPSELHRKEQRLSAMCERLSARLQQYKSENEQLEEMLRSAEKDRESFEASAATLRKQEKLLADKGAEVESVRTRLEEVLSEQVATRAELASAKEERGALVQGMNASEARVVSAVREETDAVENRLEAERRAHQATKTQALAREQALEAMTADHSEVLSSMQRKLDERCERVAYLEKTSAVLEQDCAQLGKELAEKERQQRHAAANKQEAEAQLLILRKKVADLEAVETNARNQSDRDRQRVLELEKQLDEMKDSTQEDRKEPKRGKDGNVENHHGVQHKLNEMTDLLYLKQAQLEKLASDKAAIQMSLEKELNEVRRELKQAKQTIQQQQHQRVDPMHFDIEADLVPIERHQIFSRLSKSRRLAPYIKKGARALDLSASTVTRLIKDQPLVRIIMFLYLVFLHVFLYFIMSRLQGKAIKMDDALKSYQMMPQSGSSATPPL